MATPKDMGTCTERLVDVLVNNAMLKSFSKMIKTLRQVLNKTKYNKNFKKKLTANITFTVKEKKRTICHQLTQ